MVAPARAGRWLALVVCQLLSVRPFMAPAVSPLAPRRVARSVMEKKADVVHTKEEKERELVEKALMDEWMTAWEDEKAQEGFDWEMEKLRRYAAGLTVDANGDWVRSKGSRDWTFSPAKVRA